MNDYEQLMHPSEDRVCNDLNGQDDITLVLAVLQGLAEKSCHPVVRVCLEQAYDDIVHLTSHGDAPQEYDGDSSAAE